MSNVTYFVAVPFVRDDEGNLLPGEPRECPNGDRPKRMAQGLAEKQAGAIAFSRTGDPERGDFGDAVVLGTYGSVDAYALAG